MQEYVPMFFRFFFEQLSLKTLVHYSQIIKNNGAFRQFDYGKERNRILYGSEMPPEYQIGNIAQPVHLLVGRDDFLSDVLVITMIYRIFFAVFGQKWNWISILFFRIAEDCTIN